MQALRYYDIHDVRTEEIEDVYKRQIVFNAPTLYNALKADEAYKEIFENTVALNMPDGPDNSQHMGFITGWQIMNSCKDKMCIRDRP